MAHQHLVPEHAARHSALAARAVARCAAGKQHGQGFDVACIAGDENCFDPNNDPKDGREDGPRDRAPGRRMRVLMSIWCFLVFCFAMTRHNSKTHRNLVNEVRWLDR